mgnify:CR=1 FL=1
MKICLCGSTRFMSEFHRANVELSLAGHIVYSVATSTKGDFIPSPDQKTMLDLVHLRKVKESDYVVVVGRNADGSAYIGESTRREIMWASVWRIPVLFYDESNQHELLNEMSPLANVDEILTTFPPKNEEIDD